MQTDEEERYAERDALCNSSLNKIKRVSQTCAYNREREREREANDMILN